MKIGFVLDDTLDQPDGVQQYILTLGQWLRRRGHEVHYLVAQTERRDIPNVHSLGRFASMSFNGNRVRTPLPSGGRVRKLLDQLQLEVLHVQMPYSPLLGGRVVAAAGTGTAIVGTFHVMPAGVVSALSNRLLGLVLLPGARRFAAVVAVSRPAAEFAHRAYGLRDVGVLPPPVVLARPAGAGANRTQHAGPLTVAFLGRLVERKGVLQLIRAFRALPAGAAAQARLVVGGGGRLAAQARELAQGNSAISFAGFVPEAEKARFLSAADVAVFPATGGESFGIILTEAMAAGAGVVLGGRNPGYASVLGGQPESLVDPADTAAFAQSLAHFITDATARQRLHEAQQELVRAYDIEHIGPEVEALYQRARAGRV